MKKSVIFFGIVGTLMLVNESANAGFIKGDFSATRGMGDAYLINCDNSGSYCGLLTQSPLGHYEFFASDGSEWYFMNDDGKTPRTTDPTEELENGQQVQAVVNVGQFDEE